MVPLFVFLYLDVYLYRLTVALVRVSSSNDSVTKVLQASRSRRCFHYVALFKRSIILSLLNLCVSQCFILPSPMRRFIGQYKQRNFIQKFVCDNICPCNCRKIRKIDVNELKLLPRQSFVETLGHIDPGFFSTWLFCRWNLVIVSLVVKKIEIFIHAIRVRISKTWKFLYQWMVLGQFDPVPSCSGQI